MAESENSVDLKRKAEDNRDGDEEQQDSEWVGPMPNEATTTKKRKGWFLVAALPWSVTNIC